MRGSHSGLLNLGEAERLKRTKRTEVLLRLLFSIRATHSKGEGRLSHGPNEAIRHSGELRLGPRLSHAGWDVFKISTLGLSSHKHGGDQAGSDPLVLVTGGRSPTTADRLMQDPLRLGTSLLCWPPAPAVQAYSRGRRTAFTVESIDECWGPVLHKHPTEPTSKLPGADAPSRLVMQCPTFARLFSSWRGWKCLH